MSAVGGPAEATTESVGVWSGPRRQFIALAYGFSWLFWIGAWAIAAITDAGDLLFNENLVWELFRPEASSLVVGLSLLSLVGVYGPLIAGVIASRADPAIPPGDLGARLLRVRVGADTYGLILLILVLIIVPTLVVTALTTDLAADAPAAGTLVLFLLVFFVIQVATSGTEEVGWRGYLTHTLLPGRGYWDTGWAVGPVWAVWHYPIVIQIFLAQGMGPAQIIGSLVGFSIGIVAMAILQAWFYERTHSVFVAILIHAVFNTIPLTIVLLFEGSPAAVLSNLLLWAVVIFLKSRTDKGAAASDA